MSPHNMYSMNIIKTERKSLIDKEVEETKIKTHTQKMSQVKRAIDNIADKKIKETEKYYQRIQEKNKWKGTEITISK
jgi:hypothetical protein